MCLYVYTHTHECVLIQWIREIIVRNDYPLLRRGGGETWRLQNISSSQYLPFSLLLQKRWELLSCLDGKTLSGIRNKIDETNLWGKSKRKVCISSKSGCIASKVAGITEITTKRSWSHPQVRRRETDCWERIDTAMDNQFSVHYHLIKMKTRISFCTL